MAMRRPRIKPTALLTNKRKFRDVKNEQNGKPWGADSDIAKKNDVVENKVPALTETTDPVCNVLEQPKEQHVVERATTGSLDNKITTITDPTNLSSNVDRNDEHSVYVKQTKNPNIAEDAISGSLNNETPILTNPTEPNCIVHKDKEHSKFVEKFKEQSERTITESYDCKDKPENASNNRSIAHTKKEPQMEPSDCNKSPQMPVIADGKKDTQMNEQSAENNSFKCPPSVEFSRNYNQAMTAPHSDDVFYSDMEEAALQADLQRNSSDFLKSQYKTQVRQRIRPVPAFQRRSSFVGIPNALQSSTEEGAFTNSTDQATPSTTLTPEASSSLAYSLPPPPLPRRERHYSASMCQTITTTPSASMPHHHYTPHKFTPSMGRIRTESNCSAFSDSYITPTKVRKPEDGNQRAYSRRDCQARIAKCKEDKSKMRMFDLIYYNPDTNPMEQRVAPLPKKESTTEKSELNEKPSTEETKTTVTKVELEDVPVAMPVPQLKLNADGDLILDEQTLEIETTAELEARKVLANSSLIVLDDNTGMNGFYKRRKRTKDWPPEETIKFYRCLQTVGTDFSLMCELFPKRARRDLKLKFKKEERNNLALINKALLYPKIFNIDALKEQLETEAREREEAQQQWKEIKEREPKPVKKVRVNTSKAARALKNGTDVYENENVLKQKMSKRANSQKNNTVSAKKIQSSLGDEPTDKCSEISTISQVLTVPQDSSIKLEASNTYYETSTPIKVESLKLEQKHMNQKQVESQIMEEDLILDLDNNVNIVESLAKESDLKENVLMEVSDADRENLVSDNDADIEVASNASVNFNDTNTSQELEESDIQKILLDLAEGSLVLVSTLDPNNENEAVNEIYMMNKETGEICDTPLDIPESIVEGILSILS